ncbi:hypothetical protein ACUXST_000117 [Sphingomonas sp. F9_3S_D5_B_2]
MTLYRTLLAGVLAAVLTNAPAVAGPHGGPRGGPQRDAERAFRDTQQGRAMPLPQLERRVMPFMGGADYLGPELNGGTYRLKFMQDGRVIWVDIDSQTGRIIRRSR